MWRLKKNFFADAVQKRSGRAGRRFRNILGLLFLPGCCMLILSHKDYRYLRAPAFSMHSIHMFSWGKGAGFIRLWMNPALFRFHDVPWRKAGPAARGRFRWKNPHPQNLCWKNRRCSWFRPCLWRRCLPCSAPRLEKEKPDGAAAAAGETCPGGARAMSLFSRSGFAGMGNMLCCGGHSLRAGWLSVRRGEPFLSRFHHLSRRCRRPSLPGRQDEAVRCGPDRRFFGPFCRGRGLDREPTLRQKTGAAVRLAGAVFWRDINLKRFARFPSGAGRSVHSAGGDSASKHKQKGVAGLDRRRLSACGGFLETGLYDGLFCTIYSL